MLYMHVIISRGGAFYNCDRSMYLNYVLRFTFLSSSSKPFKSGLGGDLLAVHSLSQFHVAK